MSDILVVVLGLVVLELINFFRNTSRRFFSSFSALVTSCCDGCQGLRMQYFAVEFSYLSSRAFRWEIRALSIVRVNITPTMSPRLISSKQVKSKDVKART